MGILFTALMIGILAGAELDIFVPSFPEIQSQFGLSPFMAQFTLSLNFIAYCVCSLFAGTMGDKFDRKNVLIVSFIIFIFGSILCIIADYYSIVLIGRILQGIGVAGPSVLGYILIAETYSAEKQVAMIGWLHGIIAFAMAAAPILGSYIASYFGWRGNFAFLLIFSVFCLIAVLIFVPKKKGNPAVSMSLGSYIPLFRSKELMLFLWTLCFFMVPYWVFIGLAPILYRQDLGVSLEDFGFYQGALACTFSITSALSGFFLKRFGQMRCVITGLILSTIHIIAIIVLISLDVRSPAIITAMMAIASAGVLMPINMLYPYALDAVAGAKSRISALLSAARLIISALGLWLVSSAYDGTFFPIGIWDISTLSLAVILTVVLLKRNPKLFQKIESK